VANATKNRKSKEGRHVGLDFYDLLIEALIDPVGQFSMSASIAWFRQLGIESKTHTRKAMIFQFKLLFEALLPELPSYCSRGICVALVCIGAVAQNTSTPQRTTPDAQVRIGNEYLDKKDYSSAMAWFRKAAEKDNPAAENNVGWLYEKGFGVKQDYGEAMNWFRKAASQGYPDAQNNIGWLYQNGWAVQQDYAEAMTWYRKASEKGNARASANIGFLFSNGLGVKQDYAEGASWYRTADEQGSVKAEVYLGRLYQNGQGVEQNYLEAMAWYSRAADKGDSEAQTAIGHLYQEGLGVKQDYAKAMAWYRKAADQGSAAAEYDLGSLYEKGLGVPQDHSKGEEWYKKANDHILLPGGIRPPRAIFSPDPEYSKEAREAKFQGTCVLSLIVGADGNPRDIKVVRSLGKGLDQKAIDAVKTWRFEPATKDGVPVATQITMEVDFRLK